MNTPKTYTHLKIDERAVIQFLYEQGHSIRKIAKYLNRAPSTISRELMRNSYTENHKIIYSARKAQAWYKIRKTRRYLRYLNHTRLWIFIFYALIFLQYSPEQIAGRLRMLYPKNKKLHISFKTIYNYIYFYQRVMGWNLVQYLRRGGKKYRKNWRKIRKNRDNLDIWTIQQRPEIQTMGHWEGDTIEGKKGSGYVFTFVEKLSRYTIMLYVSSKKLKETKEKVLRKFNSIPKEKLLSITYDNGIEMLHNGLYKIIQEIKNIRVYFTDPGKPYQRGLNENTNGLIRQYLPKGIDFRKTENLDKIIQDVEIKLNHRARKCLQYQTPYEIFFSVKPKLFPIKMLHLNYNAPFIYILNFIHLPNVLFLVRKSVHLD
ncbi:MAG: IS30 family transposase [Leptospiraceae bacterium]|nr:MAG: IS30 family transposase [Leptospiraceae bacterium]